MLLRNLQLQALSIDKIKQGLENLNDVSVPELDELEIDLGDYYDTALTVDAASSNYVVKYATEVSP